MSEEDKWYGDLLAMRIQKCQASAFLGLPTLEQSLKGGKRHQYWEFSRKLIYVYVYVCKIVGGALL